MNLIDTSKTMNLKEWSFQTEMKSLCESVVIRNNHSELLQFHNYARIQALHTHAVLTLTHCFIFNVHTCRVTQCRREMPTCTCEQWRRATWRNKGWARRGYECTSTSLALLRLCVTRTKGSGADKRAVKVIHVHAWYYAINLTFNSLRCFGHTYWLLFEQ